MTTAKPRAAKKAVPTKPVADTPPQRELNVWYLGNFRPAHSTENHVARALRHNGMNVRQVQEDEHGAAQIAGWLDAGERADFVLWTRTRWGADIHEGLNAGVRRMLRLARLQSVPVVGYHLDIWWGLKRESEIASEPFFEVDLLVTADGGHERLWEQAGVRHLWMPPAISLGEAEHGQPRDEFISRLAFVGSHDGGYHREHEHRHELVRWLRQNFRRDCAFWPQPGQHAVRGKDLQDLYASVGLVVGDSCFAGTGLANYWSDRIPETLGRGGALAHPYVPGLAACFILDAGHDPHLLHWDAGDWTALGGTIEFALSHPEDMNEMGRRARLHVREHHTYERRMTQLVDALRTHGMLP